MKSSKGNIETTAVFRVQGLGGKLGRTFLYVDGAPLV